MVFVGIGFWLVFECGSGRCNGGIGIFDVGSGWGWGNCVGDWIKLFEGLFVGCSFCFVVDEKMDVYGSFCLDNLEVENFGVDGCFKFVVVGNVGVVDLVCGVWVEEEYGWCDVFGCVGVVDVFDIVVDVGIVEYFVELG